MEKFMQLLSSRKFWAALIGLILTIITGYVPDFPITEDQLLGVVWVLVAYIIGTGFEDGLSRSNLKK